LRLPFIIGVVIVAVVVAAGIVAPHLRSSAAKEAEQARQDALLAERLLHRYDTRLPNVARLASTDILRQTDGEALVALTRPDPTREEPQTVAERLAELQQESSRRLRDLQAVAEREGLPAVDVQPLSPGIGGLNRALAEFDRAVRDNEALLQEARQQANRARAGAGRDVLGVTQTAGMVEYTQAAELLAEAHRLRMEHRARQARLLLARASASAYAATADYHDSVDVAPTVAQLQAGLAEVRARAQAADQETAGLQAQVAALREELAALDAQMKAAREELLTLEHSGFVAGDDQSFDQYRASYLAVSEHLRELQEREQLLRYGGRAGAQFAGDDLETAPLEGGEPRPGLEHLEPLAALAAETARRLHSAEAALEAHLDVVEQLEATASDAAQRYAELSGGAAGVQAPLLNEIMDLAQAAHEKEEQALRAASAAVTAFANSQQAARNWVNAAGTLQREKDAERTNERLRMILADKSIVNMGASAQASALMLVGRIYVQRIEANAAILHDLELFAEMGGSVDFPLDELDDQIAAAETAAFEQLQQAAELYQGLIDKIPPEINWIPRAGLAGVFHLLARILPAEADGYLAQAAEQAGLATGGREQSPYLREHVRFRDHLRALSPDTLQPTAEPAPAAADEPAEPEPDEGD
jgi:DNA repair exonuclease SbcCD ATPase subunit